MARNIKGKLTKKEKFILAIEFLRKNYDFKFDIDSFAIMYKKKQLPGNIFGFLNPRDFDTLKIELILENDINLSNKDLDFAIKLLTVIP